MLITGLIVIGAVFYTLIAGFALFMTYAERSRAGSIHPLYTALSVVACAAWPVTVILTAIAAVAMQRRPMPATAPAKAQTAG